MKKVLNTALCGFAAGVISYITSLIYYKILGDAAGSYPAVLAAPMMLAVGLLTVLTGGLKLFAGASGYFLYEKPVSKSTGNLLMLYAANFLGCYAAHNFLKLSFLLPKLVSGNELGLDLFFGEFNSAAASGAYNAIANSFGTDAEVFGSFFVWFIARSAVCGILIFIGVEFYKRTGKVYMAILAVFAYTIGGFSNCITTLSGVLIASAAYDFSFAAQFIIISTTALGNMLGGMLASAVLRAVRNTAEPAGAENK
ncbi:MAG: hypothetical protein ACOX4O_03735 [Eubacteriales bacterium]|jgi:formate/nitrite transporter FocA (FNT family)